MTSFHTAFALSLRQPDRFHRHGVVFKRIRVTVAILLVTNRQLDANLPVELAHVLPEHGAGDALDERVYHGVYNKQSKQITRNMNAQTVQPERQPTRSKDDSDYEQQQHIFVGC